MQTIVECVPNFSEGRDAAKVDAIIQALLAGPEVYLLDREMDADHNRSVITLAGSRERIGEAALRGIGKAAELIDLNHHQGAHPRLGATDVAPFVPVAGVTLEDCIRIAEFVAEEAWKRFKIPTYLYEAAARKADRKNLENIRRGQFEGLREEVKTDPDREPDFGPPFPEARLHPTAGATVVGARKFLIAYNINLNAPGAAVAKAIAKKIRASGGGLPCVKAMGVELKARNLAQVSMNLTDFETTSIGTAFEAVVSEAASQGVEVLESEIVGLVPRRALEYAAVHYLKIENFRSDSIVENRLTRVLEEEAGSRRHDVAAGLSREVSPGRLNAEDGGVPIESGQGPPRLHSLAESFVRAVAADTPTPGGGSVSALAGALAAALGEMVCRITLKKKSPAANFAGVQEARDRLTALRRQLMDAVDRDAASYEAVIAARKLPKQTDAERAIRARAVEEASTLAAAVPLETATAAVEIQRIIESLRGVTAPETASDLAVALAMAEAAGAGGIENVHANLPSIKDSEWLRQVQEKIKKLEAGS